EQLPRRFESNRLKPQGSGYRDILFRIVNEQALAGRSGDPFEERPVNPRVGFDQLDVAGQNDRLKELEERELGANRGELLAGPVAEPVQFKSGLLQWPQQIDRALQRAGNGFL